MTLTSTAQALFASTLQPSDNATPAQAATAVAATLARHGGAHGCTAICAIAYGDHPDTAPARMRWALALAQRIEPCVAQAA